MEVYEHFQISCENQGPQFPHHKIDPFTSNDLNFFQYSIQLGRRVLSDRRDVLPTAFQYYSEEGITPKFLTKFWVNLWARKQP